MKKVNTKNHTCLEIFAKQTADGGKIRVLSRVWRSRLAEPILRGLKSR